MVGKLVEKSTEVTSYSSYSSSSSSINEASRNALLAGHQADGKKVYLGYLKDDTGSLVAAKIIPSENRSVYEKNGEIRSVDKIEYIFGNEEYELFKSSSENAFQNAVILFDNFIGCAEIDGEIVVGNVDKITKKLVVNYNGKVLNLSDFNILVAKNPSNALKFKREVITKDRKVIQRQCDHVCSNSSMFSSSYSHQSSNYEHKMLEMQNRIQSLELELSNYKNDRKVYEARIAHEQQRVEEMNEKLKEMRTLNSTITLEQKDTEEKLTFESSQTTKFEMKMREYEIENELLLKKVSNLEESLKAERLQLDAYATKFNNSQLSSGPGQAKIKNLEEKVKTQQQKIFEYELIIQNGNVDAEALKSQLTSYESTVEHQKIQVENILKKLQNSNADNEYLIKKIAMLSQASQHYQYEIESMTTHLQNAKSTIATLSSELSKANAQLAKFQAALSHSYLLNSELMTKISSFNTISQYQSSFESKLDILGMNLNSIEANSKLFGNNTQALLEATGSETFLRHIKSSSETSSSRSSFVEMTNGKM